MEDNIHFYRPVEGHGLSHNPFNSIIAPRPIGWISSISHSGTVNLAPYSFFNAFNYVPPIIGFCSVGYKDSVQNIQETGEFCWNFVSESLAEKMNITSAAVTTECDEFELAHLAKNRSNIVKPPHVGESPVVMECKKTQIIELLDAKGEGVDAHLVMGEVVGIHIQKQYLEEGVFSLIKAKPVLRAGGPGDYFTVSEQDKFELVRPSVDKSLLKD